MTNEQMDIETAQKAKIIAAAAWRQAIQRPVNQIKITRLNIDFIEARKWEAFAEGNDTVANRAGRTIEALRARLLDLTQDNPNWQDIA